jgi:hypothetical protein
MIDDGIGFKLMPWRHTAWVEQWQSFAPRRVNGVDIDARQLDPDMSECWCFQVQP